MEWGEPIAGVVMRELKLHPKTPVKMVVWSDDGDQYDDFIFDNEGGYQLKSEHPYYTLLKYNRENGTDYKFWSGRDWKPPEDFNHESVLLRSGKISCQFHPTWTWIDDEYDIIGYSVKEELMHIDTTKPVQMINGTPMKIVATDAPGRFPIIAMKEHNDGPPEAYFYTRSGFALDKETDLFDLINVPESPYIKAVEAMLDELADSDFSLTVGIHAMNELRTYKNDMAETIREVLESKDV